MAATSKDNLKTKLTAIANAIRSKSGGSGLLTLDQMASSVSGLSVTSSAAVSKAIADIDAAWNSDNLWATIAKYGDVIRCNSGSFQKYIGKTKTYYHTTYGTQTVRCVDICHFPRSDGRGMAAFCFDHVNCPLKKAWTQQEVNYYQETELDIFLQNDFANGFPKSVKDYISTVSIADTNIDRDLELTSRKLRLNRKVFIASSPEIIGEGVDYVYNNTQGYQLEWYYRNNSLMSSNGNIPNNVKTDPDGNKYWFTRTLKEGNRAHVIFHTGTLTSNGTASALGVCPVFNIG